jgi:3-phosphoshikimate 1-carboxyvinyltransferase
VEGGEAVRVPGDKSISHRALLLAALADGESRLEGVLPGEDCRSTAAVLRALGASIPELPEDGSEIRVNGVGREGFRSPGTLLDCGNSGTTARLLLGVLAGLPIEATLSGDPSLRSRPMRRVTEPLSLMGARFREEGAEDRLPLRVFGGRLRPVSYASPVASAQIKSAILLAGITGRVKVTVVEPARSRDHTERMLRRMGARVSAEAVEGGEGPGAGWRVDAGEPPSRLRPLDLVVPGDFSSAAFFIALALLGGAGPELVIENVGLNPTRTGLLDLFREMGGDIRIENLRESDGDAGEPAGDLRVRPSDLRGGSVGGDRIPLLIDEIPILAVVGARANGTTEIRDAGELRVKESDRIRVLARNLEAIGVRVEELEDGLRIFGGASPLEGEVTTHHDHRIAMGFGVLGALPGHGIRVDDPGAASVSFPGFWDRLGELSRGGAG